MSQDFFTEKDFSNAVNMDIARAYRGKYVSLENVLMISNRLLRERGVIVKANFNWKDAEWHPNYPGDAATHQALLICVEPIEKDSAESLLREYVERVGDCHAPVWDTMEQKKSFVDRAKKLLEQK